MRAPIGYDPKGQSIYKTATGQEIDESLAEFMQRIPYDWRGMREFSDKTARTEDGRFTFEEIRDIEPMKAVDHLLRDEIALVAIKAVNESRK
jgi:hypothetical protein